MHNKDSVLEEPRKKPQVTHKGKHNRMIVFSIEAQKARRAWRNVF